MTIIPPLLPDFRYQEQTGQIRLREIDSDIYAVMLGGGGGARRYPTPAPLSPSLAYRAGAATRRMVGGVNYARQTPVGRTLVWAGKSVIKSQVEKKLIPFYVARRATVIAYTAAQRAKLDSRFTQGANRIADKINERLTPYGVQETTGKTVLKVVFWVAGAVGSAIVTNNAWAKRQYESIQRIYQSTARTVERTDDRIMRSAPSSPGRQYQRVTAPAPAPARPPVRRYVR